MKGETMDARFKILLVGKNKGFIDRFKHILEKDFQVETAQTSSLASKMVSQAKGEIAAVLLNLCEELDKDPIQLIKSIRHNHYPELILCINPIDIKNKDIGPIVKLIRYGADKILELPSFTEEILLYTRKAVSQYRNQKQLFDDFDNDPGRKNAFFDFLTSRKEIGIPVLLKEMELFFPSDKKNLLPLDKILSQLKNPPVKDFKEITVLIVEDEVSKVDEYQNFLKRFGYRLLTAKSSKEAEKVLKQESKIDIVILDIGLDDGTSGNDLVPVIKSQHPSAEIIMLTAWEKFDLIVSCLKDGAFDYLIKTKIDMDVLSQKILQALYKQSFDQMVAHHMECLLNEENKTCKSSIME